VDHATSSGGSKCVHAMSRTRGATTSAMPKG
jgi:hypothetical protein